MPAYLTSSSLSGQGVTINVNGVSSGTTAGAFTGTFDGGSGPVSIIFWCIDLFKHVSYPPFSYTGYTAATFESSPLTFNATQQLNLARLFTNEFRQALLDAQHSAAFQLAIWDILFDNDANLSTSGGTGFGVIRQCHHDCLAQGYVNTLGTDTPNYPLIQLTSREHQDFITPGSPSFLRSRALAASAAGCRARGDDVRDAAPQSQLTPHSSRQ